jgi:peptide/nickel transport system permease protein
VQAYIVRRLLQAIPVIILDTFLAFALLLLLPGDPVTALIGASGGASLDPQQIKAYRHELGLDRPVPVQYAMWLDRAVQGDLGRSTRTYRPVSDEIKARLPVTAQVGAAAFLLSLVIAIPAGVASAVWRNSLFDRVVTVLAVGGVAIPGFFLGVVFILLFAVKLRWLPPSGFVSPFDDPVRSVRFLALPVVVLGWEAAALLTRQTRSGMLEVLAQDYMRTARAKGLRELRVVWVHALRNGLLAVVTVAGLLVGRLLAGAVIIETIFAIPGMGRLLVSAIGARDIATVQAVVLIIALSVVIANLLTDVTYAVLDPRIRYR